MITQDRLEELKGKYGKLNRHLMNLGMKAENRDDMLAIGKELFMLLPDYAELIFGAGITLGCTD